MSVSDMNVNCIDDETESKSPIISYFPSLKDQLGFAGSYSEQGSRGGSGSPFFAISNYHLESATVWHKPTEDFIKAVMVWFRDAFQEIKQYYLLYSEGLFGHKTDPLPTSFFVSLLILNQKGNILKKEIADFFRKYKNEYYLAVSKDKGAGGMTELILEFSSNRTMGRKFEEISKIHPLLNDLSFVYGNLRWKIVAEKETKILAKMVQGDAVFTGFVQEFDSGAKDIIFKYEYLRFLLMKYNNSVKDLLNQSVDLVLNQQMIESFKEELFNGLDNEKEKNT